MGSLVDNLCDPIELDLPGTIGPLSQSGIVEAEHAIRKDDPIAGNPQ